MCAEWPSFHFEGSTKPAFCMHHAEDGMVNVRRIIGARSVMERKDLDDNDVEAVAKRACQELRRTFVPPVAHEQLLPGHIKAEC